ncbi:uncharacterized protein SPPG_08501 [Spizellomyces punctatus DAOM BR117]|uniref:BZIP domain-containing protein n=1 Tax=Spizellomyces punctatus (strain DAOM BR117) TaxID=645134 RepID=A0A0L0H4J6_SPIPD|nr:uncharacterized protein SPPG_08501 [Spizellomyces punctatus DAOM BR117]KNC96112.1 hypothetical protein SPPG_08501 [Spizellomyces punctatus DAOM BR117]|eukprot:XP_016604152.1 hypothetical protein SPPG_08501 [Spizellomyces punctatus DAOM BR117]
MDKFICLVPTNPLFVDSSTIPTTNGISTSHPRPQSPELSIETRVPRNPHDVVSPTSVSSASSLSSLSHQAHHAPQSDITSGGSASASFYPSRWQPYPSNSNSNTTASARPSSNEAPPTGGDSVSADEAAQYPKRKVSEKRAQQNRAAQRAFRQRKEQYLRDLETRAQSWEDRAKYLEPFEKRCRDFQDALERAAFERDGLLRERDYWYHQCEELRHSVYKMGAELDLLKGESGRPPPSLPVGGEMNTPVIGGNPGAPSAALQRTPQQSGLNRDPPLPVARPASPIPPMRYPPSAPVEYSPQQEYSYRSQQSANPSLHSSSRTSTFSGQPPYPPPRLKSPEARRSRSDPVYTHHPSAELGNNSYSSAFRPYGASRPPTSFQRPPGSPPSPRMSSSAVIGSPPRAFSGRTPDLGRPGHSHQQHPHPYNTYFYQEQRHPPPPPVTTSAAPSYYPGPRHDSGSYGHPLGPPVGNLTLPGARDIERGGLRALSTRYSSSTSPPLQRVREGN